MGLLNSNSLNQWFTKTIPQNARNLWGEIKQAPQDMRNMFTPETYKKTMDAYHNPSQANFDKDAAMAMAMDFLQTTVPGGGLLGMVKKVKPTKFEKAHEIASKKAESMLGLPPGNTAADRAKALGAVDYYHGTQRLDRLLEKGKINPTDLEDFLDIIEDELKKRGLQDAGKE